MALDVELAALYEAPTKSLNQALKRNSARFPPDILFQLSQAETKELNRSQNVTGAQRHRSPHPDFRAVKQAPRHRVYS